MPTAAQKISNWTTNLRFEDIPADVLEHAKQHVLDTLGCGLAAHATGVAGEGRATMTELGGEPQATVIGLESGLPAANAAFANGMLCHGLDFDDTHSDSVSHVSAVVTPASLAAGEAVGASGRDVLTAIVAGNEVVIRVGMAASGRFHTRGFHPTAVCGIFGGTASVGKLGGLDAETTTTGARHRRLDGVRDLRLPRGRHSDEADPPGLGGTRRASRDQARPPRRRRAPVRLRGQVRPLPLLPRGRAGRGGHRRPDRRPRLALGDSAHRLQAVPGLPLHARIARRGRPGARAGARSPRTRSTR